MDAAAFGRYAKDFGWPDPAYCPPELVAHASTDERARVDRILRQILPVSARAAGLVNDSRITTARDR